MTSFTSFTLQTHLFELKPRQSFPESNVKNNDQSSSPHVVVSVSSWEQSYKLFTHEDMLPFITLEACNWYLPPFSKHCSLWTPPLQTFPGQ